MKILILPAFFYPRIGGSEKSAMGFIQACQSKGWKVVVVARLEDNSLPFEVIDRVPVYRIRYVVLRFHQKNFINAARIFIQSFLRLLMVIFKFRPDIIYVHMMSENAVMTGFVTCFYRPKIIASLRGCDMILYKSNWANRVLFQRLLNNAEAVIFPSKALAIRLESDPWYYLDAGKIRIIPNGIDIESFDKNKGIFALQGGKSYIFACGRFVIDKGFDILIRAFALVSGAYPAIDLVIAGGGQERGHLESLAADLNIAERVHLIGMVPHEGVIPYYRGCMFFVLPSRFEAFGNVTLEAMAASKSVINSMAATADGLVQEGFNGYLFNNENYNMLAERIRFLIENKALRDQLGTNGRRHVEQYYSKDVIDQKITEMFLS